ncbi:MAG: HlyD family efflux transporter periplasmic adaptor subunit [Nonomuraea sp.]|nr:HlyD family efflux transporter periplasmic adaptor subunit [Nonomuraea sp.]
MRRLGALAGVGLLAGCAAPTQATAPPRPPTVPVVRTDLVSRTSVDGTLAYAGGRTLAGGRGTLTWLPREGTVIRRGRRVYGADGATVPLLYGRTPLWRTLSTGVKGADVRLVERNLAALGYRLTVDDLYTWTTARAVRAWQRHLGRPRTGTLTPYDVVVEPGPIRVAERKAGLGGPASGPIMTVTDTTRQVTVDIPVDRQQLAVKGAKVTVTLPAGRATTGHVTAVGTTAKAGSTGQTGEGTQTATIPVTIALDRPGAAGRLVEAPVTAAFSAGTRKGVLAVPVAALLGRPGGTYAVVVAGQPVTVRLGLFADGLVEVTGVAEGTRVEVPEP